MDRLQALRVFARVAELGSFTRAADALDLSRARVSESLADLERSLGMRLLHRTTRRVALTDDGRSYYERVRQILADLDELDAGIGRSRQLARGRLRAAMPIALARQFVVPALPSLLANHPELELELRLENRAIDLLEEGIDCAVSYGTPSDQGLVARRIAGTRLVTCASPRYLAEHGEPATLEQLDAHACIAFLSLASARPVDWAFAHAGEPSSRPVHGKLAFNSMEACVDAAAAGLGVTQVLSLVAHAAIRARKLRPVLREHQAEGPALFAVYPPNRQLSGRVRALLEFLSTVFADAERLASRA